MLDHPGMVEEVHRDYFEAGSTVATVNSYALHHDRFVGSPLEGRQAEFAAAALSEAQNASEGREGVRIAGAVGPLVATYKPGTHPAHEDAVPLYAELAGLLAPGVDLILLESVASVKHARAALEGARQTGKPVWLSVTVDDENGSLLRSGEPLTELAGQEPDAWLANCSAPEAMSAALAVFKTFGKPFGAYANGFVQITKAFLEDKPTVDVLTARDDITPERYADFALDWVAQGATIIGGCCETGPDHIRAVAERLKGAGHTIM